MPGNVFNRGAELRNMIESKRCDASDDRLLNHIRSVIFSTMVRLIDCRVYLLPDEAVKCYQGQELKVSRYSLVSHGAQRILKGKPIPNLEEVLCKKIF